MHNRLKSLPPKIQLNPFTLSFAGECRCLEHAFIDDYNTKSLNLIRFSLFLAIVLYAVFGLLDSALVPDQKAQLWLIRYAVVCPSLFIGILLSLIPWFRNYMQACLVFLMVIAGSGISVMVAIANPPANYSYYAGLILVFMFGYGFLKARFKWASLTGWINVIIYEVVAIWIDQTPADVLLNNNFFFISANIIGMCICYSNELYARRNYFMTVQLELTQKKTMTLNQELEERIRVRTADIIHTNERLQNEIEAHKREKEERAKLEREKAELAGKMVQQQRLEAIGTLASGVAHEINNPINGVINYAQLLLDESVGDSRAHNFAREIITETERVAMIVRNLLAFSRHDKQAHSSANMSDIVEATLSLVRTIIRHDQILLTVDIPSSLPKIKCRSQQIQQVLMNLLTNARDALNDRFPGYDDEKTLSVSACELHRDGRDWIRVTVEDHGAGIPPDIVDRILDPFFTTKGRDRGTGLGLAIVHGIVKEHQGELAFENNPGQGTKACLELPVNNDWSLGEGTRTRVEQGEE
jgi:signal transduction histidine kinase